MKITDYIYDLPEELIAQTPIEPRDHSRLLKLDKTSGNIEESKFYDLVDELGENDVLVINKTRVMNARLKGNKAGVKRDVELFLHKQISETQWECMAYPGRRLKNLSIVTFKNSDMTAQIIGVTGYRKIVEFSKSGIEFMKEIEKIGEMPLPPYINNEMEDTEKYQTVFNEVTGSSAAPTAGLHFTPELLKKLSEKGVKIEKVLLHVGLGTFLPVEVDDITDHHMHSEYIELETEVANRINQYTSEGKRIIAIGTTSIRVLESFADEKGILSPGSKDTDIFIYPGYKWKIVDAMITNFHLPKSTLLMLVSSFVTKDFMDRAYQYAIKNKFRFFSFGDAMFIRNK